MCEVVPPGIALTRFVLAHKLANGTLERRGGGDLTVAQSHDEPVEYLVDGTWWFRRRWRVSGRVGHR